MVEVDLPLIEYGVATYYVLATAEASANLARFDGIRYGRRASLAAGESIDDLYARSRAEGFGREVQRRIMLGTHVLSAGYYDAYYRRALQARRLIRRDYDAAFERCDVILGPASPGPAFPIGAYEDPLAMYLQDRHTVGANIAGLCALSLPAGFAETGGKRLPVAVQLQARPFDEERLLRTARVIERASGPAPGAPV
jgi:aspartyl-tRNA(Asn)/glutamyl-tRNA(Gln) amidotransferase subunit A